jgi:uncharacterized protein YdhG (YjbR/CyaY superfamily)
MVDDSSARERYFPAIETKHGEPVNVWFERLATLGDATYPDQMALLQDTYGFSRTHANALVMTHRGSTHARRFASIPAYLDTLTSAQRTQIVQLIDAVATAHPDLEQVIAYNQPMFRMKAAYVVGFSASQKHVSLNPFSADVVAAFAGQFAPKMVTAHTLKFALDEPIDPVMIGAIVTARRDELGTL